MFCIDCETTGVNFAHGSRPFFVGVCDRDGEPEYYEWDVNPLTRMPAVPPADVKEIRDRLARVRGWSKFAPEAREDHKVVGQSIKFDVGALRTIGVEDWPWSMTEDTLIAAHLLGSNRPKNLTALALQFLGENIEPYETRLDEAVKEVRRIVQQARLKVKRHGQKAPEPEKVGKPVKPGSKREAAEREAVEELRRAEVLARWSIAEEGHPMIPSCDKPHKNDLWLPRAYAKWKWETGGDAAFDPGINTPHPYWTLLRDYANVDTAVTVMLWPVMKRELERRGLMVIYRTQMRLPPVARRMEDAGVTGSIKRHNELQEEFHEALDSRERVCVGVAKSMGYDLVLPKNGANTSLREFCFGPSEPAKPEDACAWCGLEHEGGPENCPRDDGRYLMLTPILNPKAKTLNPTLDAKNAIPYYLATLPPNSKALTFVRALADSRKYATALSYLESYSTFMISIPDGSFVLYPNLNITGTDTLRWSANTPNTQQISKQADDRMVINLRREFGPAPGREWWSLDAKNIELRIPFYESGEQSLIDLFERPDAPPYYGSNHLANFHAVYPDLWAKEEREVGFEKVGPHCKKKYAATWYQHCKNGGFCKQYGGQERLTDATFRRPGAYKLLEEKFNKLTILNRRLVRFAEQHGYVETLPDRSVDPTRGYPLLCTRTEQGTILPTVPLSYHVQGSAMWWTDRGMVRSQDQLDEWRDRKGYDGRIVMQVHDELVFDLPKRGDPVAEKAGEAAPGSSNLLKVRCLQVLMAQCGEDFLPRVPTPVGCEYHPSNWGEGVSL